MPKRRTAPAPPPDSPLPATQRRSQETLDRLVSAAEDALREDGLEGATLRGIADRAGVSVGIVYRRFPDKDTILRAVYIRFFEKSAANNRASLEPRIWQGRTVTAIARMLIEGMAAGYEKNRALLRALILYGKTHEDAEFKRRAQAVNESALEALVALFESRASEIDHPNPRLAIRFAVKSVAGLLQERIIFATRAELERDQLITETNRLFLRYLGVR
jgi:AcrR family transcriptional regulator